MSRDAQTKIVKLLHEQQIALGAKRERERIIKLLEKHGKSKWCGEEDCPRPFPTEHLIALIKGENK